MYQLDRDYLAVMREHRRYCKGAMLDWASIADRIQDLRYERRLDFYKSIPGWMRKFLKLKSPTLEGTSRPSYGAIRRAYNRLKPNHPGLFIGHQSSKQKLRLVSNE